MKLKLLIIGLFLFSFGYAQIEVTPNGLRNKTNFEQSFLVINTPDKKADELYKNAVKYVNEKFTNPKEVIKGNTENEYLRFETYIPQFTKVNNSGAKMWTSMQYAIELRFKDNKVKFEITNLSLTADNGGHSVTFKGSIWKGYPIYSKKEKLRLPKTKKALEDHFNAIIKDLSDYLNGKASAEDDW